ncbi:MAG: hypothetical protein QXN69_01660 [Candidatus Methanomethylicaceae archaeon]
MVKYLKIVKEGDIYKKCEIRKNLRYGRGKRCSPEEAEKIITSGAILLNYASIGKFLFATYEIKE